MTNLNCPTQEINIASKREVIDCDSLKFPWNTDPNGYFLVKIDRNIIHCGFVNNEHKMIIEFKGRNPDLIIKEIVKRDLCNKENLAYISSEIMIAYNCIVNNKKYIQR